jgi:predicted GNAT superfamily acetyltransferase
MLRLPAVSSSIWRARRAWPKPPFERPPLDARLLDSTAPSWSAAIDQISEQLNAGSNPTLLPGHFLQVVLPKLGGGVVRLREGEKELGVGFLLPRGYAAGGQASNGDSATHPRHAYTLRYHPLCDAGRPTPKVAQASVQAVSALLPGAEILFYDPSGPLHYEPTSQEFGSVSIGRPSAEEAAQIPALQQENWGSAPAFLYPADLHSVEFQLGSSLVARVDGELAAFLFGFHKFDGPPLPADWSARFHGDLRLESQTLGVLPAFRGIRIANLLKRVQGEQAWQASVGVVNWTADPLQFPNAALNFGLLRALAFDFYPDLYPFRNALNRVPASRFGLTWLVGSERAQNVPPVGARSIILDLHQHPDIERVNEGFAQSNFNADSSHIAIEIPDDWTTLQATDVDQAAQWRAATDRLFDHYVGTKAGQYIITGVAIDHDRHFLIGQKVDDALLEHLGHVGE